MSDNRLAVNLPGLALKNPVIPTFFWISEHQISLFTSRNAPEIFLGLAAQNGIVVTPRHLFYFNLLSLSL